MNTKLHAVTDASGRLLRMFLTAIAKIHSDRDVRKNDLCLYLSFDKPCVGRVQR
jgi:hypothetical protein